MPTSNNFHINFQRVLHFQLSWIEKEKLRLPASTGLATTQTEFWDDGKSIHGQHIITNYNNWCHNHVEMKKSPKKIYHKYIYIYIIYTFMIYGKLFRCKIFQNLDMAGLGSARVGASMGLQDASRAGETWGREDPGPKLHQLSWMSTDDVC